MDFMEPENPNQTAEDSILQELPFEYKVYTDSNTLTLGARHSLAWGRVEV